MLTTADIQAALQIAVFAVVFCDILTAPKMILDKYGRWLDRLEQTHPALAYPLGYCAKCFGGQVALWMFPVLNCERIAYSPAPALVAWLSFVSLAILSSALLSALWVRLTQ